MQDKGIVSLVASTGVISVLGTIVNKAAHVDWPTLLGVLATVCSLLFAYQQTSISVTALRDTRKKSDANEIDEKLNQLERLVFIRIEGLETDVKELQELSFKVMEISADYTSHKASFGHSGTISELINIKERISALEALARDARDGK